MLWKVPTPVFSFNSCGKRWLLQVFFLLARCSPLLEYCPQALIIVTVVGGMTSFFAATTALVQNDLKKSNSLLYL